MTYPEGICFDKVHDPSGYSVVSYTDFKWTILISHEIGEVVIGLLCSELYSFNSFIAYGQSKLANILHTNELSRILKVRRFLATQKYAWSTTVMFMCQQGEGVNISANTVHPGVIMTSLFRNRTIVSGNLKSQSSFVV
jgi:hypothetical protein